jgi:hypothetical protein
MRKNYTVLKASCDGQKGKVRLTKCPWELSTITESKREIDCRKWNKMNRDIIGVHTFVTHVLSF